MKFYVDNLTHSNLHQLSQQNINVEPLTFDNTNFFSVCEEVGFKIAETDTYDQKGIYLVSVRCYADMWSGKKKGAHPRHVLYEIPPQVINAARNKKVIIVIDNQSEGLPLIHKGVDGFYEMHVAMNNLDLPRDSVLLIDNNAWFKNQYTQWCIDHETKPLFNHTYFLTGFFYFHKRTPTYPLIHDAIRTEKAKSFNSLNRTARIHRVEHLYYLISNNLLKNGIVSGHYTNDIDTDRLPVSTILEIEKDLYANTLKSNLPLIADKNFVIENPDFDEETIFNHSIYKNSLLSFVTETAFHQQGMFITEKTFKPIVAGHPFIILGQYNILKELRRMGYRTDFPGIDQSYDDILNPVDRFYAAHASLEKWVNTSRNQKNEYLMKSLKILRHNQKVFVSHDYVYESYKKLFDEVSKIFLGTHRRK